MRSWRAILAALVLLLIGLVAWKLARDAPPESGPGAAPSSSAPAPSDHPAFGSLPATPPRAASTPPERSTLADALNSPATDIRADLRLVASILETSRSNFPADGNPVGNNADITATLTGRNRLRLALIPADHPAINADGELCDRWGTPFFFHAESATRMEIRSAGPDRKMWSADDVVLSP